MRLNADDFVPQGTKLNTEIGGVHESDGPTEQIKKQTDFLAPAPTVSKMTWVGPLVRHTLVRHAIRRSTYRLRCPRRRQHLGKWPRAPQPEADLSFLT